MRDWEESKHLIEAASLGESDIHVYCLFTDDVHSPDVLNEYESLLTQWEREKVFRYFFEKDRKTSLISRALLKMVLSGYTELDICHIDFVMNSHGKPELKKNSNENRVRFNLSHTRGMIVLAVILECDIGTDVESFNGKNNSSQIARHFFSEKEVLALQQKPECLRNECFYEFWTLKEAYIKAIGLGLSIPLDTFSFLLDGSGITIEFQEGMNDQPEEWFFYLSDITPNHKLAIAVKSWGAQYNVSLFRCIPFVSVQKL